MPQNKKPKRGSEIASRLERDFLAGGWKAGQLVGTQLEIQSRYNIGRCAFREAVRILEMRGAVKMRRGTGGGLIVQPASLESALRILGFHFVARQVTVRHLATAKRRLALALVAMGRLEAGSHFRDELHNTSLARLAAASGNRASMFLANVLAKAEPASADTPDSAGTADEMLDLDALIQPRASLNHMRYALQLAVKMIKDIRSLPMGASVHLGSERKISMRYNYSSDVVRQAARVLEDLELVKCHLGRGGGLVTCCSDSDITLAPLLAYLNVLKVSAAEADHMAAALRGASRDIPGEDDPFSDVFCHLFTSYSAWLRERTDSAVLPVAAALRVVRPLPDGIVRQSSLLKGERFSERLCG